MTLPLDPAVGDEAQAAWAASVLQYLRARALLRPVSTAQLLPPPYAQQGTTAFTAAQWPALTFIVPPSGQCFISISGNISNTSSATAQVFMFWSVTAGVLTVSGQQSLSAMNGRQYATKRVLCTGTPGASVTLTPQWGLPTYTTGNAFITDGLLVMEPVL